VVMKSLSPRAGGRASGRHGRAVASTKKPQDSYLTLRK